MPAAFRLGKGAPKPTARQLAAEAAGVRYWESPLPPQPLPRRDREGCLAFDDHPEFRPNLTPEEVLRRGAFGGGYFRSITSKVAGKTYRATVHEEFPPAWFQGLDVPKMLTSDRYNESVNEYGAKCGNSLDHWEASGWIRPQDPYGWFHWYCRFFLGRRTADDERQIGRWLAAIGEKGRWRTYLVGQCVRQQRAWNDPAASPATRQTLLHWGYQLTKADFNALAPAISAGKSVIYLGPVAGKGAAAGGAIKKPAASSPRSPLKRPASASAAAASKKHRTIR